jgi:CRISPR/Cas system-associated protein Csm6
MVRIVNFDEDYNKGFGVCGRISLRAVTPLCRRRGDISPSRGEIKKERKISPDITLTFVITRPDRAMAELERFQNLAPISPLAGEMSRSDREGRISLRAVTPLCRRRGDISPSRGEIKKERKISPGVTPTLVIARPDRAMTELERFQDLAPISPLAGEMSRSDREGYLPHFPVA